MFKGRSGTFPLGKKVQKKAMEMSRTLFPCQVAGWIKSRNVATDTAVN